MHRIFYDDFCKTEVQQAVFKEIMRQSKSSAYISIQELDHLGLPQSDVEETLAYFERCGLFAHVQHLGGSFPVMFAVKA